MPAKILLPVVLIGVATGCSTLLWETGLPWTKADFRVTRIERRAMFLDVQVESDGLSRRYFTRATDTCVEMLRRDAVVTLGHGEGFGPFESGEQRCSVAGIGDLEKLRGSRSRGGYGRSPIRRSSDRIEIVHRDEAYLYARGGFSIGALFGWAPGTDQVVALLPLVAACRTLDAGGPVSVLYRDAGAPALGIAVEDGVCPIRGLVGVLPQDFEDQLE